MKKYLLGLLTGIIITSITAGAAYVYTARDIEYTPSDDNWNVSNVNSALNDIKTDINNINDLVDQGDMLYQVGSINLIANVSDDSFYTDTNGKYVIADSTTGRSLLENASYKSLASTDLTFGEVGSDFVSRLSGGIKSETVNVSHSAWSATTVKFTIRPDIVYSDSIDLPTRTDVFMIYNSNSFPGLPSKFHNRKTTGNENVYNTVSTNTSNYTLTFNGDHTGDYRFIAYQFEL